ncbi:hypothetical protein SAMN04487948_105182 [Halogranum amylolyticum]|uniref:Uncharacterized protein n=1 Tax=Halogranum amylolyticum TaxID=660520 RepID=A0A1H8SKF8_9EURY|nr:hypothetical protein [Halogranum amylolyticum]SEO79479.1 hypothetical protein SAMN04487948_105182 [Halogranum amylolyticum]
MPSTDRPSARRALLVVTLAVTLGALAAPAVVSAEETYTLSYVGVDYEANAIHDEAYFWSTLGDEERATLTSARRAGTATLAERPWFLDGDGESDGDGGDVRFSVVRDERVYQYSLDHTTSPWWFDYRTETALAGLTLAAGTVGWSVVRRVDALWE